MAHQETKEERIERLIREKKALFEKILVHPDPQSDGFRILKRQYNDKRAEIRALKMGVE